MRLRLKVLDSGLGSGSRFWIQALGSGSQLFEPMDNINDSYNNNDYDCKTHALITE